MINETVVFTNLTFSTYLVNNTVYGDKIIKDLVNTYTSWDRGFFILSIFFVLFVFYRGYLDKLPLSIDRWEKLSDIHFTISVILGVLILYWCMFNLYLYYFG